MEERRRFPRVVMSHDSRVVLPLTVPVKVIDVSLGGVLLESTPPVNVEARGILRVSMGGAPFAANIEVRRVSDVPGSRISVGARFVSVSVEHRQVIERFTNQ